MYIKNLPVDLNFTLKNKNCRIYIDEQCICLYQIFEDKDDELIFMYNL